MMKNYLKILKPGIILGNCASLIGGFSLSSKSNVHWSLLFYVLFGTSLIIASNCILNNIIDVDIDKKMFRTSNRVLPKDRMSLGNAYIYAIILGILGLVCLYIYVNLITVLLSLLASFIYVCIYSLFMKRNYIVAPLIGGISGAMPPIIGYVSINGVLDIYAYILFLIFLVWQIPHFCAIYIYRIQDYKNAKIPVFPIKQGILWTKHLIVFSIFSFILLTSFLFILDIMRIVYFIYLSIFEIVWLMYAIYGYQISNNQQWSKILFLLSVVVIIVFDMILIINHDYKFIEKLIIF